MRPEPNLALLAALRPAVPPPPHERVAYELARLRVADTRALRPEYEHLRRMHD